MQGRYMMTTASQRRIQSNTLFSFAAPSKTMHI